ncbi:MAG: NADH-quinone oxidoreductase subunit NuoK [Rickettsiaceae bacterium]
MTITNISIEHYLVVSSMLFAIGIAGIFIKGRNLINILLSIELMLLSVNINFVAFSSYLHELSGQIFALCVLAIAAAETAIGLAIIIVHFRNKSSMDLSSINQLKG